MRNIILHLKYFKLVTQWSKNTKFENNNKETKKINKDESAKTKENFYNLHIYVKFIPNGADF